MEQKGVTRNEKNDKTMEQLRTDVEKKLIYLTM